MNSFAKESSQNIDNTLSKSKTLNYSKGKEIKTTYNDIELNSLDYEDALKDDNRTYIQYYFSLLRTRHILIFSFLLYTDIIKYLNGADIKALTINDLNAIYYAAQGNQPNS